MKSSTHLDSLSFQLTPTRTRCDLVIAVKGKTEKIASGLLKPFLAHLKTAQDQIDKGGYSILLEPGPDIDTTWFTKGTVERFVRFVSTPEILERVYTLESEIVQLEKAISIQGNTDMGLTTVDDPKRKSGGHQEGVIKHSTDGSDEKAIVLYKPDAHSPESNGSILEHGNSKVQLLKVLETRKTVLQKEQGMAFARAAAAGFVIDHMTPLLSFAECFGASRLMEACLRFIDLWKGKHETGQWLEIEAAEAMSTPSDFSALNASGITLSSMANQLAESAGVLASENNEKSGHNPGVVHQAQVSQQEYYQGQFPYPVFPTWPVHSPPGTVPVYQPYPVQGVPFYQPYPGSGPFFPPPHPPVEDSGHDNSRRGRRRRHSVDHSDTNPESEASEMEVEASENRGSRKKAGKSGKKQSGRVVIRNINFVASKGKSSSDSDSQEASDSETVKEDMNKDSSSLKRKGRSAEPVGELNANCEERISAKESDVGHWEAFQSFLLRDSDEKSHGNDQGIFGLEKSAQIKLRQTISGGDPLAIARQDRVEARDGRTSELHKFSGSGTRMLRPSNSEGLVSREEDHQKDSRMDVQFQDMNGRKLAYRKTANDDFITMGRERQSYESHSADLLSMNMLTQSHDNINANPQDMTDESYVVPFRSMSLDQDRTNERTAIDVDSELPSAVRQSEHSSNNARYQVNYEPDDLGFMPNRGTEKSLKGYDPALEFEMQVHAGDSASLDNQNKAAIADAKQVKKLKTTPDSVEKKKAQGPIRKGKLSKPSHLDDARARAEKLRSYKADLQKLKKEKEEEQQKRLDALKKERQERIAARGSSMANPSQSSLQTKKQLPNRLSLKSHRGSKFNDSEPGSSSPLQRSKIRTVSAGSTEIQKASNTSKSSNDIQLPGNRVTRSVSSLPDPRKDTRVTPDSKASMARIRRLSEPKASSSSSVTSVKLRTPPSIAKPKISSEPESKKIAAIINLDKSKAATLPELKIKTSKAPLEIVKNKPASEEMTQKMNGSSASSGNINEKNLHQNNEDDNPIIDKTVVMFEPEKHSIPVHASHERLLTQKEQMRVHGKVENVEIKTGYAAAFQAPASPPDVIDIQSIPSQLQEQPRSYEVSTSSMEKKPPRTSTTHPAEKPYQPPFARLSSTEDPCTLKSLHTRTPSVTFETVSTGNQAAKAQLSGLTNLKMETVPDLPEKTQAKGSPKGFKRLLKFGKKSHSSAASEQNLELDQSSVSASGLDDNTTNAASSSEVHSLKNLISQDESPVGGTTAHKSSRHFSILSPFRSKTSEKKSAT